jgi:hypothetical protein
LCAARGPTVRIYYVSERRVEPHLRKIDFTLLPETSVYSLPVFIGNIEPKPVEYLTAMDEDGGILRKHAAHPTGQDEDAGKIARADR